MAEKKKKLYGSRPAGGYLEPKDRVIKRLEDAGNISGRTKQQADQENKIDAIFDSSQPSETPSDDDKSWMDEVWDKLTRKR